MTFGPSSSLERIGFSWFKDSGVEEMLSPTMSMSCVTVEASLRDIWSFFVA